MIDTVRNNPHLFLPLIASFLFFIRKGLQYFLIGSYLPLLVVTIFLLPFLISFKRNKKRFLRFAKIWAIAIIVWAIIRTLFSIINYFTHTFDEFHLSSQFGFTGIIINSIMIVFGIYLIRYSNSNRLHNLF